MKEHAAVQTEKKSKPIFQVPIVYSIFVLRSSFFPFEFVLQSRDPLLSGSLPVIVSVKLGIGSNSDELSSRIHRRQNHRIHVPPRYVVNLGSRQSIGKREDSQNRIRK